MITGIEIPFTFALFYPSLNKLWWYKKITPQIDKEIYYISKQLDAIELFDTLTVHEDPFYVFCGSIMVPIAGRQYEEDRKVLTKHIHVDNVYPDKKVGLLNYHLVDSKDEKTTLFVKTKYVNTYDSLNEFTNKYEINHENIKLNLPLKVNYYYYKKGVYLHSQSGQSAENKNTLVKTIKWQRRLPGTIILPISAAIILSGCWLWYSLFKPIYRWEKQYYPPFHPKRYI